MCGTNNSMLADPHSLSNASEVKIESVHFDLRVDFDQQQLIGSAKLSAVLLNSNTSQVKLDTNRLTIHSAQINGEKVAFTLSDPCPNFGRCLSLPLPESVNRDEKISILINYETSRESSAIQWLSKEQTADQTYPYLFTQCQAIHARSLFPCQDTPQAKITYTAKLTAPQWSQCLMSAVATANDPEQKKQKIDEKSDESVFTFEQSVAVPSYLVAIVCGRLQSVDIGPRSRVWAEPSVVQKAASDFKQTEEFLSAAEEIMSQKYVWGRYDLVCLPPSFPYGGMENPCLTFVTPTLLTGDCSLADVIAHEIAHSWTGNLITNETWEHFWLNEGYTVWLERKIMSKIHNEQYFHFVSILGLNRLRESIALFGADHEFTKMCPNLSNVDPDDSFSAIPYEKGFNFLFYLEQLIGTEDFLKFTAAYVQQFKYKTITTSKFQQFFTDFVSSQTSKASLLEKIEWEKWYSQPGDLVVAPNFDQSLIEQANQIASLWASNSGQSNCSREEISQWRSTQMVAMLEKLGQTSQDISLESLLAMEKLYNLNDSTNAEVAFSWQMLCLACEAEFILPIVEKFVLAQGRMKFVRPLYRTLFKSKIGNSAALRIFEANKNKYHPIAQKMVAKDLQL